MARKKENKEEYIAGSATARHVRISPRKVRLVLDAIRGKHVSTAGAILSASPKKAARIVNKVLHSAVKNVVQKGTADADFLWVFKAWADEGRTARRYLPRARGRATRIRKRSSHITIVLAEK